MAAVLFALAFTHGANAAAGTESPGSTLPKLPAEIARKRVAAEYGKLPVHFEANAGQTDCQVRFLSRGAGYTLFLTSDEAVLALPKSAVLRMKFLGANREAKATGLEELPGVVNYFIGSDPKKWHANIPTFGKVEYRGVYPGVDLQYYGLIRGNSSTIWSWRRAQNGRRTSKHFGGRTTCVSIPAAIWC